ncbi:hypothetical protein SK3146_06191 [Paenibacillus konkukensis]|uniref:DUF4367 domain-containing protein n=1 Tax=Paenibacillus konkukensis TaxID=2020716 RepID=A0ABY4RXG6_9BACL|nr:DUF4367 domain-containing protein [Paenibacillus konkukensis]UQZ86898.1 hypothetical protein SK3146_06191 [Paenibacillus konkukensis]
MENGWLLLFKQNIAACPERVQYALFEQFVEVISRAEPMRELPRPAARQAVKAVFLQAAAGRFRGMDGGRIARRLEEMAREQAVKRRRAGAPAAEREAGDPHAALLEAWGDIAPLLKGRAKRRRRARLTAAVCGFAVILLAGGFMFGTASPSREAAEAAAAAAFRQEDDEAPLYGPSVVSEAEPPLRMTEAEGEAAAYADFKLLVPKFVPPGYTFQEASVWGRERGKQRSGHIIFEYANEEGYLLRVSFVKMEPRSVLSSGFFMPASTEELPVRGSKGLLVTSQDRYVQLNWMEDNVYISISGRELDKERLLKMAESLS